MLSTTIYSVKFLFLMFIALIISGCTSQALESSTKISFVSLTQKNSANLATATIYPTYYTMKVHDEVYKYDLSAEKWLELNKLLESIDLKKLSDYPLAETNSRLVVRDLESQIHIQTSTENFESPIYHNAIIPEELLELYRFLESFFPLN